MKFTVKGYAKKIGKSEQSIYKKIRRGTLKSIKENDRVYVLVEDEPIRENVQKSKAVEKSDDMVDFLKERIRYLESSLSDKDDDIRQINIEKYSEIKRINENKDSEIKRLNEKLDIRASEIIQTQNRIIQLERENKMLLEEKNQEVVFSHQDADVVQDKVEIESDDNVVNVKTKKKKKDNVKSKKFKKKSDKKNRKGSKKKKKK